MIDGANNLMFVRVGIILFRSRAVGYHVQKSYFGLTIQLY